MRMRAVAFSVWIFINLAFLGMGGYVYLILSTYWCRKMHTFVQPIPPKKIKFDRKNQVVFYETKEVFQEPKDTGEIKAIENTSSSTKYDFILKHLYRLRHRRSGEKPCNNGDSLCTDIYARNESKLEEFKNKLFIKLRRVLHEESNVFKTDNPYFVNYKGPKGNHQILSSDKIKCRLKKVGLRLLSRYDYPFSNNKFGKIIGDENFLDGKHFNTCAIVSSAGSLINSGLGLAIDNHDIVLRFNHAPTETFDKDVGTKTTIRLVNSQVVSKNEFKFTTSPLYKNVSLVVWDPSNYSSTLKQWFEKPDFDFFESWAEQKLKNSKKNSFIVDPQSVWKIWNFIQSLTSLRIRRNPPSSGFLELSNIKFFALNHKKTHHGALEFPGGHPSSVLLNLFIGKNHCIQPGLVLLMPYCDVIDFFEFVPSIRMTKKCHYFDSIEDESCTFGVWHPLSAEKMLSLAMNEANDTTVFETGFIRIHGYKNLKC